MGHCQHCGGDSCSGRDVKGLAEQVFERLNGCVGWHEGQSDHFQPSHSHAGPLVELEDAIGSESDPLEAVDQTFDPSSTIIKSATGSTTFAVTNTDIGSNA